MVFLGRFHGTPIPFGTNGSMRQIKLMKFQKCFFFSFCGAHSPQTPPFFSSMAKDL